MNYIEFGKRLRQQRKYQNISLVEMSRRLHFSPQHLGNIEHGYSHPSVELLVNCSNILNVSIDYLLQDSLNHQYTFEINYSTLEALQFLSEQQVGLVEIQKLLIAQKEE